MVYLDLLIIANFLLDYSLLTFVGSITRDAVRLYRLLMGTLVAVSSLVLFYVEQPLLFIFLRIIYSFAIIYATFGFKSWKIFLIKLLIFYALSYILAGILISFNLSSSFMQINFFDYKVWILLLLSFLIGNILIYTLKKQLYNTNLIYKTKIIIGGNVLLLSGFLDTGNDAMGEEATPIVFISKALSKLNRFVNTLPTTTVPIQTLNISTLIHVFKPDAFFIKNGQSYKPYEVYIGVIDEEKLGGYEVILNRKLFD